MDEIRVELGKIKGYIEKLKVEIAQEKINRISLRQILVELKLSLERTRHFLSKTDTYFENLPFVSSSISLVNSAFNMLETTIYKDENIRTNITKLIFSLDSSITNIIDRLSLPLTGISQIGELIGTKPAGLDENWAVANCYLSAMEIVVNKRLKEEGIKTEEKDFISKFKALLKVLENKGIKVSEIEKELPSAFWRLRNQVIHAGYSPTQEELDLITTWIKKFIRLITD